MKDLAQRAWRHFLAMPSILRGLTVFLWVMGALVVILPFLQPFDAGTSEAEYLSVGERVISFCLGLGMLLIATLICQGRSWVRHALMLGIAAIGLSVFVHPDQNEVPAGLLLFCTGLIVSLGAWYFYLDRGVRRYFAQKTK